MIRFINKFKKRNVTDFLIRDKETHKRYRESFEYVCKFLKSNPVKDLNDCEYYETKNYDYYLIEDNEASIIIRKWQGHFTLFMKHKATEVFDGKDGKKVYIDISKYSIGMFEVNTDERENEIDDNFYELNKAIPQLLQIIKEDEVHIIWNDKCFEVDKNVKAYPVLIGEEIDDVDEYIFALEEIFRLHFEMFCEYEVVERLKHFKVGDTFGKEGVIKEIRTDDKYDRDTYYHGIGLLISKGKEEKFEDVYSLARWYYDETFGKQVIIRRRKLSIEHNGKTYYISYDRGWLFLHNIHEIDGKTIYSTTDDTEIVKELLKVDFMNPNIVRIEDENVVKEN